jgi:DMSO/TMAO reductase YedYZ molybdopterin-dependent catalytic subunit
MTRVILQLVKRGKKQTKNKILQATIVLMLLTIFLITPTKTSADTSGLNLQIINLGQQNITLTSDDILALPKTTVYAELSCYGSPISNGNWSGVKLSDLLSRSGISSIAGSIDFLAADGYKVTIPMETTMLPEVIIAYELDGNPLKENTRLVIPGANGNLWISMITSITLSATQVSGGESLDPKSLIFNQYPGLTSANGVPTTQKPPQIQTPATISENKATINPTNSPTSNSQNQSEKQTLSLQSSVLPVGLFYGAVLGVIVATIAVSFVVYSRRKAMV